MFSIMVNGSLEDFFHGRKGLCHGDSLSLFLIVTVMEVLSRLLNRWPKDFHFHHQCEKIRLTHLLFADAMILCGTDMRFLQFMKDILMYYEGLVGLKANVGKNVCGWSRSGRC